MGLSTGAAIGIAVGAMFVILFFVCVALRLAAVNSAAAGAEMESAADGLFAFGAMFGGGAGACVRACVRACVLVCVFFQARSRVRRGGVCACERGSVIVARERMHVDVYQSQNGAAIFAGAARGRACARACVCEDKYKYKYKIGAVARLGLAFGWYVRPCACALCLLWRC